jgi:hypothetical protein
MKMFDTDEDGKKEPLFEEVDEAAEFADSLGLEGGVHAQEAKDETMWAPGDSPSELDQAQREGRVVDEIAKMGEAKDETMDETNADDRLRL